ncbi:TlyA family RNA methyltransferase [Candidatus Saccharibacteria bacterium]|nr:TlyA family RNA methyltransferase [Candidatus Saccharibacteria bacterium]
MKQRLDKMMVARGLAATRSEAANWIQLGRIHVNGRVAVKAGEFVDETSDVTMNAPERYVSRAGLKLASVAHKLAVSFDGAVVLDVGSSTGGFTDYALQHGARLVYAVDVGTNQLHPKLREDARVELHEKTDIRDFSPAQMPDVVVIDASFISLRQILPHVRTLAGLNTKIIAMVKPQFEAGRRQLGRSGVIKNNTIRRQILADFEAWAKHYFVIIDKKDSDVAGVKGNLERFYELRLAKNGG